MGKLSESQNLKYRPLFALLLAIIAFSLSRVTFFAAERLLLPRIYSTTQPTTMPLRMTDKHGTLSNGDTLRGWRNFTFFVGFGVAWFISIAVTAALLAPIWPTKTG